ncbi:MAG: ribonuclease HII [Myxococcota bacterium]
MRLSELRERLLDRDEPLTEDLKRMLQADPRVGARRLLQTKERRQRQRAAREARQSALRDFDRVQARGQVLAGVDEAGMSPWAGPIVAAAVILPPDAGLSGVDDSKTLQEKQREALAEEVKDVALAWSVAGSSPEDIGRLNVHHAGLLAMRRAVAGLRPRAQRLIVDARRVPGFAGPQSAVVKADAKSLSVAAASILAKTTRDRLMRRLDEMHPSYGFRQHKGYGVEAHRRALLHEGPCPHHRLCFDALRDLLSDSGA